MTTSKAGKVSSKYCNHWPLDSRVMMSRRYIPCQFMVAISSHDSFSYQQWPGQLHMYAWSQLCHVSWLLAVKNLATDARLLLFYDQWAITEKKSHCFGDFFRSSICQHHQIRSFVEVTSCIHACHWAFDVWKQSIERLLFNFKIIFAFQLEELVEFLYKVHFLSEKNLRNCFVKP